MVRDHYDDQILDILLTKLQVQQAEMNVENEEDSERNDAKEVGTQTVSALLREDAVNAQKLLGN